MASAVSHGNHRFQLVCLSVLDWGWDDIHLGPIPDTRSLQETQTWTEMFLSAGRSGGGRVWSSSTYTPM
jgi:hypothetical protein